MKKLLQHSLNILSIGLVLLIIYFNFSIRLIFPFDESWNFQSLYKFSTGFALYKDINIIVTPLFFYIGKIFMFMSKNHFWGFRLYAIILNTIYLGCAYLIMKNLRISKWANLLTISIIYIFIRSTIDSGVNYNTLAIIFYMLGVNLILSKKSNNLAQSVIIFLILLSKQNLAIFYLISLLLIEFINKKNIKHFIIDQSIKALYLTVFISIFTVILLKQRILFNFIDLTILNISDFTNNISFELPDISILFFVGTLSLFIFSKLFPQEKMPETFNNEVKNNLNTLFIFSIILKLINYPIFNKAHLTYSLIFDFIFVSYFFNTLFINKKDKESAKFNISLRICILFILIMLNLYDGVYTYAENKLTTKISTNSPINNCRIETDLYESLEEINNFIIEEKENSINTIFISNKAALSNLIINNFNWYYDQPFIGNLGSKGEDILIENIRNKNNINIIIAHDENDRFYQESDKLLEYIENNLEFKKSINIYDVYYKK